MKVVAALILTSLCASPVAAWAADSDENALIRHGLELRRAGDDEAALAELQRAYDREPSPRSAAQLGFVEQALGQWAKADEHIREALRTPDDPWIHRNRAVIEDARDTIGVHLARHPPPAAVVPPAFDATASSSLALPPPAPPPPDAGHKRVMLGLTMGGVGIAALLGGGALLPANDSSAITAVTMSPSTAPSVTTMPPSMVVMPPSMAVMPPPIPKKKGLELAVGAPPSAALASHPWAADALFVVGGAALVTGGVLVVTGEKSQREGHAGRTVSLRPLLAPGGAGATVKWVF
jgi:hypothetical protein